MGNVCTKKCTHVKCIHTQNQKRNNNIDVDREEKKIKA